MHPIAAYYDNIVKANYTSISIFDNPMCVGSVKLKSGREFDISIHASPKLPTFLDAFFSRLRTSV